MRPSCRMLSATFSLLLALVVSCAVLRAQAASDSCAAAGSPPSDLSLQLSLHNGQTTFHEGEIIALDAQYASSSEKKYIANTRNYDRSGRLDGMEVYCLDPASGTDPLADYFNGSMGFFGGGLSSDKDLGSDPYVVPLELNEWKTLPPGSYRLRIVSHRVLLPTDDTTSVFGGTPITLQSNEVDFEVVSADSSWQAAQLAAALRTLDAAAPATDEERDQAKHAARILRFLQSEASTRELARRFSSGNDQPFGWELKFGLFGSPYRSAAIEGMKAALRDPQHPITQEFIQTLALLEMASDPAQKLPPYDDKNQEAWHKTVAAHFAAQEKLIAQYTSELAASAAAKTGEARSVTVSELLQSDASLNPAARIQLRQLLLASWDSLPVRRQNELIEFRWEQIGGPELLPILRKIASGEPNRERRLDKLNRALAVKRIYELAPDEGRTLILREIAHPQGDIGIGVLGLLPEHELPQVEASVIANLRDRNSTQDIEYDLVDRYAGVRVLPDIQPIYEAGRGAWACAPQNAMLRYFLRVSPDYGLAQVRDAISPRNQAGCHSMALSGLNEYLRRPRIEQLAIQALDDPSLQVVRNAAEALQANGSPKAEAALWTRLEKFHEQWKDRADELRYRRDMQPGQMDNIGLEQTLVQAIASAQGWFANEDTIRRLQELASPQEQSQLDGILTEARASDFFVNLNWWPEGALQYSIGRYNGKGMGALKEKLAQFPPGAHLNLVTTQAERDRHSAEFADLESAASTSGLTLQIQTPR